MSQLDKVVVLSLPKIADPRGCLTIIQQCQHIPFEISEVVWYPLEIETVKEVNKQDCDRAIVALSGMVIVNVSDQDNTSSYRLDNCWSALYIPESLTVSVIPADGDAYVLLLSSNHK